ncbi:hypothetical protein OEZ85_004552 [Tetradesmus obliquus]|uniref:Uncharacterized protein n=1 Tax=Tetradesmus obliquus TaxID=3088 RepID=A0ABY8UL25_TETOB|nr:hypothetical protein OEZ85_004552 [Tetradesmus obliquus]
MWDEATVARARSRLDDVAKQLSKELGFQVALRMPPAKFNPRELHFDLTFTASSTLLDIREEHAWNEHCAEHRLKRSDRLRTFRAGNAKSITLVSIEPKNKKYPIIAITAAKAAGRGRGGKRRLTPQQLQQLRAALEEVTVSSGLGPDSYFAELLRNFDQLPQEQLEAQYQQLVGQLKHSPSSSAADRAAAKAAKAAAAAGARAAGSNAVGNALRQVWAVTAAAPD